MNFLWCESQNTWIKINKNKSYSKHMHANRKKGEKRSHKEYTAEAAFKVWHRNTNGILMEENNDSGKSHTRTTCRQYCTNLLAALQVEGGQSTMPEGGGWWWEGGGSRKKQQKEETTDMERKQVRQRSVARWHQADVRLNSERERREWKKWRVHSLLTVSIDFLSNIHWTALLIYTHCKHS